MSSLENRPDKPTNEFLINVKTFDLDKFLKTQINKFTISYVGTGYYGIVFRVQNKENKIDLTLKLMRFGTNLKNTDLATLFHASKLPLTSKLIDLIFLRDYRGRSESNTKNLALAQAKGHKLGNQIAPRYIDPPSYIWIQNGKAVGYSLPFLTGKAIKICTDKELTKIADHLENNFDLFLGSRGENFLRGSKNAIILNNGSKKFIDVRLKYLTNQTSSNPPNLPNNL